MAVNAKKEAEPASFLTAVRNSILIFTFGAGGW